jgi:histidine ammonia-lyase
MNNLLDPIGVCDISDIPPYTISEESDNVSPVFLDGSNLSIEQLILIAREHHPVALSTDTAMHERIECTYTSMQQAVENNEIIYGVTTGFGGMANTLISRDERSI